MNATQYGNICVQQKGDLVGLDGAPPDVAYLLKLAFAYLEGGVEDCELPVPLLETRVKRKLPPRSQP